MEEYVVKKGSKGINVHGEELIDGGKVKESNKLNKDQKERSKRMEKSE